MKLLVGLGNPGKEYENTRHNVGFWFIDHLAELNKVSLKEKKFKSIYGKNSQLIFLKPQTFMNVSGEAVLQAMQFFKLTPADLLIIHDDLDLPPGTIRFREKGSSGGHNGLNSIIEQIGTNQFSRLKLGIGKPLDKAQVTGYVLSKVSAADKKLILDSFPAGLNKVEKWLNENV